MFSPNLRTGAAARHGATPKNWVKLQLGRILAMNDLLTLSTFAQRQRFLESFDQG
jgi:hypothetical protein